MSYALPAHRPLASAGAHPGEDDVLALLRPQNRRRLSTLDEGIREAVTLLQHPDVNAGCPSPPACACGSARRQAADPSVDNKDQMSARAQITADRGGQPLTPGAVEAPAASPVKQVSERLPPPPSRPPGEAAPGALLQPRDRSKQGGGARPGIPAWRDWEGDRGPSGS